MKSREKEELTVEQPGETEQQREMHLSSASVAALDLLQMPQDETQNGEPQTGFVGEANNVKESGPTNDRNDNVTCEHAITAGVGLDCCEHQVQQCVVSGEEHAPEMDWAETETHSSNVNGQRNEDGVQRHGNKESLENSKFRSEESDLQLQDNNQDFTKSFQNYLPTKAANTELQQKPKNGEEAEVETNEVEGVSTRFQPQANATSGKKKKKKRKGKKKGKANEDSEKDKNEDDAAEKYVKMNKLQLTAVDDVPATDVPRTFTDNGKINPQQIGAEDQEGSEKSSEPAVQSKTLEDPTPGDAKKKHSEDQTSEAPIVVEEQSVKTVESFSHIEMPEEVHTEHNADSQDVDEWVESEKIDKGEVAKANETLTPSETVKEPTMAQVMEEGDEEVNLEVDKSPAAAAEVEELECMTETISHTAQQIAIKHSLVLEVQSSGTGGAEEMAETTGNHSGDGLSEESGMGHPEEERSLGTDSLEKEILISSAPLDDPGFRIKESRMGHPEEERNLGTNSLETETSVIAALLDNPGFRINESGMGHLVEEQSLVTDGLETETSIIPVPLDDPGFCIKHVDTGIGEVNEHTSSPNNPGELTDILVTDAGADPSDAQDNTAFTDNESESGSGEAKPKENLEGELQAKNAVALTVPETSEDETSLSKSSTDGLSDLHALSESLTALQPGANTNITVTVIQDGEESEQEAVTAKKEEDGKDESLAGDYAPNADSSDYVMSPNLVIEEGNITSRTRDDNDDGDGNGDSATRVYHESEGTRIVDMSEAPDGPAEADGSTKRQSTDGTSKDLSPNLRVSEADDEDDEGQSFDFDDLDLEVAFAAKSRLVGGKAQCDDSNDCGSVSDQCDSESKDNAQPEVDGSHVKKAVDPNGQADFQQTAAAPSADENMSRKKGEPKVDEQAASHRIGPVTGEKPDQNPTKILVVEESVDAAKHLELQDEQAASEKEPLQQQARKDSKKNSKKGKTKGKEDCKMS